VTIIDGSGKFVVPGFIDSHIHTLMGGERLNSVNLKDAASKNEFINKIGEFAKTLQKGEWITGGNWDHINWGGEWPHRNWIDGVTPNNPVWINRHEGHTYLANSLALKIAGINEHDLLNVEGIMRDSDMKMTGIFKDNSLRYVYPKIPYPTFAENKKYLESAMDLLASYGVTSIHHLTEPNVRNRGGIGLDYEFFKEYDTKYGLRTKVYCAVPIERRDIINISNDTDMLRMGSVKCYVDGSIGSLTAAFSKDYIGQPGFSGQVVNNPEDLYAWIKDCDDKDIQVFVHAIGDRGINIILDVFERVLKANGVKDRRWRVEHAQHIDPKDIVRFKELGVMASMQPSHLIDDSRFIVDNLEKDLVRTSFPVKSLLKSGAVVAFGSDWFVSPPNPIHTIDAAVNRIGSYGKAFLPEECISVEEALYCSTYLAAYSIHEEHIKGSLMKGKAADLAILDRNLLTIDPKDISNAKVVMTITNGKISHQNSELII
jgi:predicted amidohydrolase YtcJ